MSQHKQLPLKKSSLVAHSSGTLLGFQWQHLIVQKGWSDVYDIQLVTFLLFTCNHLKRESKEKRVPHKHLPIHSLPHIITGAREVKLSCYGCLLGPTIRACVFLMSLTFNISRCFLRLIRARQAWGNEEVGWGIMGDSLLSCLRVMMLNGDALSWGVVH